MSITLFVIFFRTNQTFDMDDEYYDYYDDGGNYYYDEGDFNFNVTQTGDNEYLDIFVSPSSDLANISTNDLLAGASRIAQAALNASPDHEVRKTAFKIVAIVPTTVLHKSTRNWKQSLFI